MPHFISSYICTYNRPKNFKHINTGLFKHLKSFGIFHRTMFTRNTASFCNKLYTAASISNTRGMAFRAAFLDPNTITNSELKKKATELANDSQGHPYLIHQNSDSLVTGSTVDIYGQLTSNEAQVFSDRPTVKLNSLKKYLIPLKNNQRETLPQSAFHNGRSGGIIASTNSKEEDNIKKEFESLKDIEKTEL